MCVFVLNPKALNPCTKNLSCINLILLWLNHRIMFSLHGLFFEMARECHHGGGGPNLQVDHNGINKTTISTVETNNFFLNFKIRWKIMLCFNLL